MNAGIKTHESALDAFALVKNKKKDFAIFTINADKTFVVSEGVFPESEEDVQAFENDEKEKNREANFNARVFPKFKSALVSKAKTPAFAVLDMRWVGEGRAQDKLIFVFWCPDGTPVKEKMLAASTYQTFASAIGVERKTQVTDASDIDYQEFISKCK